MYVVYCSDLSQPHDRLVSRHYTLTLALAACAEHNRRALVQAPSGSRAPLYYVQRVRTKHPCPARVTPPPDRSEPDRGPEPWTVPLVRCAELGIRLPRQD